MSFRGYRARPTEQLELGWRSRARCASDPQPDRWFTSETEWSRESQALIALCFDCPVRRECLTHALTFPEVLGIWGGMHPRARARARRHRLSPERAYEESLSGRVA